MVQLSHKLSAQNLHPQAPEVNLIDMTHEPSSTSHCLAKWPYEGIRPHWVPQKKTFSLSMCQSVHEEVRTQSYTVLAKDLKCFWHVGLILYSMILLQRYHYLPENYHEKHSQQASVTTTAYSLAVEAPNLKFSVKVFFSVDSWSPRSLLTVTAGCIDATLEHF